jgi:ERCC4-related helicase
MLGPTIQDGSRRAWPCRSGLGTWLRLVKITRFPRACRVTWSLASRYGSQLSTSHPFHLSFIVFPFGRRAANHIRLAMGSIEIDHPVSEPAELRLRSYQQEMFDASLERNVIVAMDTGSGKTHIAIARILTELENGDPSQLIWFMSPSVALSNQQYKVLNEYLAAYQVITLTGEDKVEKWTDQRLWNSVLSGVRVVVGTPAALKDALTHGFVRMQRFALLIFDEAHRCIKNSPLNTIMKHFYHPTKLRGDHVPHVLGLSASPVMSAKQSSLADVEANLNAVVTTPKREREALEQHVHPPNVVKVPYRPAPELEVPSGSAALDALRRAVLIYDFEQDSYNLELAELQLGHPDSQLGEKIAKQKTYSFEQLGIFKNRAEKLCEQIGLSATNWYTEKYIARFRENMQALGILPHLSTKEQHHVMNILDQLPLHEFQVEPWTHISHKAEQLVELLQRQAEKFKRGIVFVEQRVSNLGRTRPWGLCRDTDPGSKRK